MSNDRVDEKMFSTYNYCIFQFNVGNKALNSFLSRNSNMVKKVKVSIAQQ